MSRPPLHTLTSATLRVIARTGTLQERNHAKAILAMRRNPRATAGRLFVDPGTADKGHAG